MEGPRGPLLLKCPGPWILPADAKDYAIQEIRKDIEEHGESLPSPDPGERDKHWDSISN